MLKAGDAIFSSDKNPRYSKKTLIGFVSRVEENICHYCRVDGVTDSFILKFKDGLNKNVTFGCGQIDMLLVLPPQNDNSRGS